MFNFKKLETKSLEELELIEINLIENLPLEYAYVMPNSKRVIQKENRESLINIILKNPYSAEYVKLGAERDFELTSSIPEFKGIFSEIKRKKSIGSLFQNLLLIIYLTLIMIFGDLYEEFLQSKLMIGFGIFFFVSLVISIYKIVKFQTIRKQHLTKN